MNICQREKSTFVLRFVYLGEELSGFGIEHYRAARHVYDHIFAIFSGASASGAALTVAGKHVAVIFQWKECPHLRVATQDNVSAAATVATIGSTLGHIFRTVEVT